MGLVTGIPNFAGGGFGSLTENDLLTAFRAILHETGGTTYPAARVNSTAYVVGDVIVPVGSASGNRYQAIIAGTTASSEPSFTPYQSPGQTLVDGTVTWINIGGSYHDFAGNLDDNNISSSAGFSNLQKSEPFGVVDLHFHFDSTAIDKWNVAVCPCPLTVFAASLAFAAGGAVTGGTIDLIVNGSVKARLPAPSQPGRLGFNAITNLGQGPAPAWGSKASTVAAGPGDMWGVYIDLAIGDLVVVSFSNATMAAAITTAEFVLFGKTLHVP